jgi:Protein of unknown function (DUF3304)
MTALKNAVAAAWLLATVGGCAIGAQQGYIEVRTYTANYTDKYVDYSFYDTKDRPLGLGGGANPFNKGGTGGGACCAALPGPGQTVRVVWEEEPVGDDGSNRRSYTRDVKIIGSSRLPGDSYNYLITRFFPDHQIEVEFVSQQKGGASSPRADRLFYGQRIMRRIGE